MESHTRTHQKKNKKHNFNAKLIAVTRKDKSSRRWHWVDNWIKLRAKANAINTARKATIPREGAQEKINKKILNGDTNYWKKKKLNANNQSLQRIQKLSDIVRERARERLGKKNNDMEWFVLHWTRSAVNWCDVNTNDNSSLGNEKTIPLFHSCCCLVSFFFLIKRIFGSSHVSFRFMNCVIAPHTE